MAVDGTKKVDPYYLLKHLYDILMGRTIPSFRIASVMEKEEWKSFRKALDRKDRKIFDDMFDVSILYNSASAYSAKYIRIHPIFMSIIFHHYKKLTEISKKTSQEL
jgi:hypothetical protein